MIDVCVIFFLQFQQRIVQNKQQDNIYMERDIMRDSTCNFIVKLYATFKNRK